MKQLLIWISIFTLLVMACGMSAGTLPEVKTSTNVQAPSLAPAPTPIVPKSQKVCGFWYVRETADPESNRRGIVLNGLSVTLTGAEADAPDGGKWVQVRGRDVSGWMNSKGLCGGEE